MPHCSVPGNGIDRGISRPHPRQASSGHSALRGNGPFRSNHVVRKAPLCFPWLFHNSHHHQLDVHASFTRRLASSGLDLRFEELPDIALEEAEENRKFETRVSNFMDKAKSHVGETLESLLKSSPPISALVTDFFCTAMFDVTATLGIPTYIIFPNSASLVCLMLRVPRLVEDIKVEFKDANFAVEVPGLPPLPARDLPSPMEDSSDSTFKWFVYHCARLQKATGILTNTFAHLEEEPLKALREGKVLSAAAAVPCIYPIGPLILSEFDGPDESGCLKWLDKQPQSSVLFVSFGSGATLSVAQIRKLALELEASGHRFLWAVRGQYKSTGSGETDLSRLLPEGFEIRTGDRGLAVPNWAPQVNVLSHPSTGGFLSHCGWNSTLESVWHGVPMIGWPIAAEQRMNRFMLVNESKVALEVKVESDGSVRKEQVERVVRELMEGEGGARAMERMKELREKARSAVAEGGSSYQAIATAVSDMLERAGFDSSYVP